MVVGHKRERFLFAQMLIGIVLTLMFTYLAMMIASFGATPLFLRYLLSPGSILGMRFASGRGWDYLASFVYITVAANIVCYGLISFMLLKKINWPNLPRNTRHRFWIER